MTGQIVGYIRVSSVLQNTERQLEGVKLDTVFTDRCSGGDRNRPELNACLRHLRKHDTLHVHSIDRLARDLLDLQNLVADLTKRGVTIHFHKENLQFSSDENPFNELMLQLLGAFAQFERKMIRERQREGIAIAKKKGKRIGAKAKLTKAQVLEISKRVAAGEQKKALAEEHGVSRQTLYNALAELNEQDE